ncbi:MAG: hypothetical protein ACKVX7_07405 [Planctomycetota bacterium]
MSIFYCDNCGEVIQGNLPEDKAIARETLCASCVANRDGGAARDESSDASKAEANEIPQDFSLSSLLKSGDLDLFSNDTIARRKQQQQQQAQQQRPSTLVVEENETMTTPRHEPTASGSASEISIDWDQLVPNATAEARPRPKSDASAERAATAPPRQQSAQPAVARRQRQEQINSDMWRLACLACAAKLSMQPVRKRSRISCPKCGQRLVVRPDGVLAIESVAIPKSRSSALAHFDTAAPPPRAKDRNSPSATQIGLLERSPNASGAVRKPQLESAAEAAAGGADFGVPGTRPRSPSTVQRKAPRPQLQLEDDSSFADLHAVQSRNASMMSWPQESAGGAATEIIGMGAATPTGRAPSPAHAHARVPSPSRLPGSESMKSPNFSDAAPSQPMTRPQTQASSIASAPPAPMAAPARPSPAAAPRPQRATRLPKAVAGFAVVCWLSMAALPTAFLVATHKPLLPVRWQSQVENFTATVGESTRAVIDLALKKLR